MSDPPATLSSFGVLADGSPVRAATLAWPGGLTVEVLEFGARIRRITVPTSAGPVETVLGYDRLAQYEADTSYLGPVVGRCANRIDHARFELDGRAHHLSANEGVNTLHGGRVGFDKRLWRFEASGQDARSVTLAYTSPDGEEGFEGRVEVRATYALVAIDTLEISYEAHTDTATPVNLSQHLYFNLSGDPARDVLGHMLTVAGGAITPVRPDLIPTGERLDVSGTPFDLRVPRKLGEALAQEHPPGAVANAANAQIAIAQIAIAKGFDHNWVLEPAGGPAVELHAPESGLTLTIGTDQPGMQVYSGQGLASPFVKHGAIVFEPQGFPDAVNQPSFPNVVLRPGETYRHRSTYRFQAAAPG